jgi:hypothetical protein
MTRRPTVSHWSRRAACTALALAALLLAVVIPAPTFAHHGWSGYESSTLLTLSGTITDVQYVNPHVLVTLAVPQEDEEEHVEGEAHVEEEIVDPPDVLVVMAPPSRSESRGLARDMLVPGAAATFEGYLHKTTALELRAERIIIGGLTVELR